jgi:hypothetical protein
MPAKEIKELRQSGKLEEALSLAKSELQDDPDNIWSKRNISWVYYDYLKQNTSADQFDTFLTWLNEICNLQLPAEEKMLYEQLGWQIGKMTFAIIKANPDDIQKIVQLFNDVQSIQFAKPSQGYTFLFKAFHKALKDTSGYLDFADWWDFQNFMPEDYQKEKLQDGKEIMSIAEQAYIAYAKNLLPKQIQSGEIVFDKEKALAFLPILSKIADDYPKFQYPAYYNAKLLLALGDKDHILDLILPFARKKRNDFWVWEILAEAFSNDPDKVFACYCKALSCKSPEEMLVNLRQKMATLFISRKLYNEAKTEIELLVGARNAKGYKIPNEVVNWQSQDWYKKADASSSNIGFYQEYTAVAESILFSDTPEETIIVEFVNSDRKILNFIASESKFGFFKYDRFLNEVRIGDILKVRFQIGSNEGLYQLYSAIKTNDDVFKEKFLKEVDGIVSIREGNSFGFLDDIYIHQSIVNRMKLKDGMKIKGWAIKSYNQAKKQWSWKLYQCEI